MNNGTLSNLLVLDLTRVLAGPYATMMLGDLGARVIKVEQPGRGDDTRRWGPPFTENGESAYFLCVNRNKESLTLDLKSAEGQAILLELVRRADVLVENFKVGTMATLGLDYSSLHELNPGLIYCSITGYGQTGPYAQRPGYDIAIEAEAGIMSITGPADSAAGPGEPYKVGVAIVDITTGMNAVIAILAALQHRHHTGEGQHLDLALFDTQLAWLANVASSYLVSGEPPKRYGNAHAAIVPYQTMPTQDGWLMLAVGNDSQFARLCQVIDQPDWATDARFATNPARVAHRDTLIPALETIFRGRSKGEWHALLMAVEVPCSPVNDIPTVLADPHTTARQMLQTVHHPVTGPIPLIGSPLKLGAAPPTIRRAPPLLGEQSEEILATMLGYTNEAIAELRTKGVI
ncbi:MAG: CoA transferase [Caldilineaceae bacterium]|nr:CoA transferase [Caldilineaceae bacterium]